MINIQNAINGNLTSGYLKDNLLQSVNNNSINNTSNNHLYNPQFKNDILIEHNLLLNNLNKLRSCNGTSELNSNLNTGLQFTNLNSSSNSISPTQQLQSGGGTNSPQQTQLHTQLQLVGLNNLNGQLPSNQLTPAPSPQDQCMNSTNSNGTNTVNLLNNSTNGLENNLRNDNVMSALVAIAASQTSNNMQTTMSTSNQQQLLQDALNSLGNGTNLQLNKTENSTKTNSASKSKLIYDNNLL